MPDVPKSASVHHAPRTCLKCGKKFASWGPGNRRCPVCVNRLDQLNLSATARDGTMKDARGEK